MTKSSGLSQQFFVRGYDLSGDVGAINSAGSPRGILEVTAINKAGKERVCGLTDGQLEFATWFDDAALMEHVALKSLPTGSGNVLWALGGSIGSVAALLYAKQINYDWVAGQDRSLAGRIMCQADGTPLEWGNLLTPGKVTHTGATNGASRDDAASSAYGIVGAIHCTAFTGTNITVVIQESSNNGATDPWATKLAFAQIAAAQSAERKTATGTVERYVRVSSSGTFTTADIVVAYRRGTLQDEVAL